MLSNVQAHDHSAAAVQLRWLDPSSIASTQADLPFSFLQVHAAVLSPQLMAHLDTIEAWDVGPEVVVKIQHHDIQQTMGSDLRNLGRIARFMRGVLPFDFVPIAKVATDTGVLCSTFTNLFQLIRWFMP